MGSRLVADYVKEKLDCLSHRCSLDGGRSQSGDMPAPNQVIVHVSVKTAFDPASKMYTYTYTVANDKPSEQDVTKIAIEVAAPISNIKQPANWTPLPLGSSIASWFARGIDPSQPDNGVGLVPPLGRIKPGQSVTGFSFSSPHPPGGVRLWVKGFTDAPSGTTEAEAETAAVDCPGQGDFFDVALNASTTGPVIFIPVNIVIKPAAAPPVPISPRENGTTPVAILGNHELGRWPDQRFLSPTGPRKCAAGLKSAAF